MLDFKEIAMSVFEDNTTYFFRGHMTLDPEQGCKFTVNEPRGVAVGARIMAVEFAVPKSLFKTPQLSAVVTVSEEQALSVEINSEAVATALQSVIGARVAVTVEAPESAEVSS